MRNAVSTFDSRKSATSESDYLNWRAQHPAGFVVNIDKRHNMKQYPMVHRVSDKQLSAEKNTNFTTGDYYKLCASDLKDLEQHCRDNYTRPLTYCGHCMRAASGLKA